MAVFLGVNNFKVTISLKPCLKEMIAFREEKLEENRTKHYVILNRETLQFGFFEVEKTNITYFDKEFNKEFTVVAPLCFKFFTTLGPKAKRAVVNYF